MLPNNVNSKEGQFHDADDELDSAQAAAEAAIPDKPSAASAYSSSQAAVSGSSTTLSSTSMVVTERSSTRG